MSEKVRTEMLPARMPIQWGDLVGLTVTFGESFGYLVGLDQHGNFLCLGRLPVDAVAQAPAEEPAPILAERRPGRGRRHKFSQELITYVQALRAQGVTYRDIAARLDIALATAKRWAKLDTGAITWPAAVHWPSGVAPTLSGANESGRSEASALREQGLTYRQVAKRLGVNVSTAYRWTNQRAETPAPSPVLPAGREEDLPPGP